MLIFHKTFINIHSLLLFHVLNFKGIIDAIEDAIEAEKLGRTISPDVAHERIKSMYTWDNVARRTEKVGRIPRSSCISVVIDCLEQLRYIKRRLANKK